ncbi:E3 ubiquitin-protein ligase TRIM58 isoform X3 [Salmo salar]|uniref:E3 ubiquitin-protein ligase TRIM58 isoform X3 n=2 Tax=Salmo salar TaxID=8030 RepID=A0A1S3NBQ2_SALSA|nr:E3 ubiquitin-protein ligase TRIM58 isoform X3 [Salmo salar]XP_045558046.1 E3 ubiquitin-protein ligase TRIM58 isoform X3 [Salmo salar]|eukprot:XP_014012680.1 PREDICTED: E3 ubiquitin-protein ligase TRIM58-like isoform X2 [Salmo salar]
MAHRMSSSSERPCRSRSYLMAQSFHQTNLTVDYGACFQLIKELAKEVKDINKHAQKREVKEEVTASLSLDSSRSLILKWSKELNQLTRHVQKRKLEKAENSTTEQQESHPKFIQGVEPFPKRAMETEDGSLDDLKGTWEDRCLEKKILDWAVELKNVSKVNCLSDEDIESLLRPSGKESRLASALPLLEFVAWSLLSHDSEEDISVLWLSSKQRACKTGNSIYIPNSAWQWILSVSVPIRLDPNTSHPLLAFSDDKLEVSRGSQRPNVIDHPCRFNSWHCVLGDRFFTSGHHYWEVEATPTGSWRLGLTTVTSSRRNRFEITPAKGYWTLWGYWTQSGSRQLFACNDQPIKLPSVNWVGIYLDYEEGQVSFYDVEKRSHIYTFSDTFKGGVVPVFACLDAYTKLKIVTPERFQPH